MEVEDGTGHPTRYCTIRDNVIEQHYGGGIYLVPSAHHNLLEGNVITNCGETTTFGKPGIQVSGSNNSIRKNVIYNPESQPITMEAQVVIGTPFSADNNFIYNNTIYNCWYGFGLLVKNNISPECSAEGNLIANNIFFGATGNYEGRQTAMAFYLYDANADHNWCDPDIPQCLPYGTHWGGNAMLNNCIRRSDLGADDATLISWARDADYGGGWVGWDLAQVQATDPVAWGGNIGSNPVLRSESPETFGLTNGWWQIQETSPCVNAGITVYDEIGAYVASLNPEFGWGNLTYAGSAPDIGAYELDGENPAPLSGPFIRISPTSR